MATGDLRANFKTLTLAGKDVASQEYVGTKIEQDIKGIRLSVQNNGTTSSISLKAGETVIDTAEVKITGFLTVGNLTDGQTIISGDNIKTGTIDASLINVTNLNINNVRYNKYPVIQCTGNPGNVTMSFGTASDSLSANTIIYGKQLQLLSGFQATSGNEAIFFGGRYDSSNSVKYYLYMKSEATKMWIMPYNTRYYNTSDSASGRVNVGDSNHYFAQAFVQDAYVGKYAKIGAGSDAKVGFFGATPITKKTVYTVATNAASSTIANKVNEVINSLKGYGLL